MTAGLRATAVRAFFMPERLAIRMPHVLRAHHLCARASIKPAASKRSVWARVSRHLEIRPFQSTSPEA